MFAVKRPSHRRVSGIALSTALLFVVALCAGQADACACCPPHAAPHRCDGHDSGQARELSCPRQAAPSPCCHAGPDPAQRDASSEPQATSHCAESDTAASRCTCCVNAPEDEWQAERPAPKKHDTPGLTARAMHPLTPARVPTNPLHPVASATGRIPSCYLANCSLLL